MIQGLLFEQYTGKGVVEKKNNNFFRYKNRLYQYRLFGGDVPDEGNNQTVRVYLVDIEE